MKKFYLLFVMAIALLGFKTTDGQVYTAVVSGSWNSGGTWDINGIPSSVCSGCSITIKSGVAVILNTSVTLTGASTLTIGTGGPGNAGLLIPNSGSSTFPGGFNIILDGDGTGSTTNKVIIKDQNSGIVANTAGEFDGIFTSFLGGFLITKIVGNPNTHSLFANGQVATGTPNPGPTHSSLNGPATLSGSGALPIILGQFDAVLDKKSVNLTWTSLIELNSDHYSIERSSDAINWKSIGIVAAAGHSETKVSYSFVDVSPSSNINYYRLQMVDRDGKYKYSPVKVVRGSLINGYSIFPNPTHDNLNVTVSANAAEELTFRLINQSGQVMQERKFSHAAGTTVTLPVSNYPQGSYILTITGSDGRKEVNTVVIAR